MRPTALLIAGLFAASAIGAQAQPRGAAPPPGDYWSSCRNVSVNGYGDDAVLTGQCRDIGGRWRDTSLRVGRCREVFNRDGSLMCRDGDQTGGYGNRDRDRDRGPGYGDRGPTPGYADGDRRGQGGYGQGALTLYSAPDFGGQPFRTQTEFSNLPKQFNDRAMSLRIEGRGAWQVCSDSDFRGRCVVFDHDVRDLRAFGLGQAVSSMRPSR